jgi:hypothetical protein
MYHVTMRSVNYDLVLQSFVKYIQNGRVYMLVKCPHWFVIRYVKDVDNLHTICRSLDVCKIINNYMI